MALKPNTNTATRVIQAQPKPQTSRTYSIFEPKVETVTTLSVTPVTYDVVDTDSFEIGGIIDGKDAIRQFIRKAILTPRFRHPIYNSQYGCELDDLVGQDISAELLHTEIQRIITEALIYDDRISSVSNFVIERTGDQLYVTFDVQTVEGVISEGVTI